MTNFQPGYRYGFESGAHHLGRTWGDVEPDLRTGWDKYQFRGSSTWENIKDAVRDAWHRVTGQKDLDADRMSEANASNIESREDVVAADLVAAESQHAAVRGARDWEVRSPAGWRAGGSVSLWPSRSRG